MLDRASNFMDGSTQDLEYHKLQGSFPESILIIDLTSVIIRTDKQTVKILGWDTDHDLIGKNFLDFITSEDRQNVQTAIQKVNIDGHFNGIQCTAVKKDGTQIRVETSGSLFLDSAGSPKEIVVVLHDISSHVSEIEQLKEAERQLSEAQQIAHFGSWEWDITSNKFHWTDQMYRLFVITPQTGVVNNETLLAHAHEEDKEKIKTFITQSLNEGSSVVDFRFVHPENASIQWFHCRSKTFYDPAHKPLRMVGTVHDITHEKEIDQVKTQFLSTASHQMRGPLTTINWNAEMLLQSQADGLTDNQKKYIRELYNASKRTVQLTNDLLTVSELELGRMPFKPERLSMQKIAKRVLEDYEHQLTEKKINFKEIYSGDLPEIVTDLFLLKTIFHELLANAVNYTPPEGTITMSVTVDTQHPNSFLITISDTGYGIPKEEQEKVFSKMFRATNAKEKVMGGTGLGLYIIKLILQLNGGAIWFTSEENKGTSFYVSIPFMPKSIDPGTKIL